jgi:uncharacterized protein with ATP-grasp and redox domains
MKTYFDCIPCFIRQALDAVRMVTDDEVIQQQVLREVLAVVSNMDLAQSPPLMGQYIHRRIREFTGVADPYHKVKDRFNHLAKELYPQLKARVEVSAEPLDTAVRLAIAGNIIDCGVNGNLEASAITQSIDHALTEPLEGSLAELSTAIGQAESILYLADNAGETFFDRLLIEQMPLEKVTVVVKAFPILNDATISDAQATGLMDLVEVIDNGSDGPGTILEDCSETFRARFERADLIVAKGQGNYETLSGVEKDIFFVLKAKCPVIAKHLGCEAGSLILRRTESSNVVLEGGDSNA